MNRSQRRAQRKLKRMLRPRPEDYRQADRWISAAKAEIRRQDREAEIIAAGEAGELELPARDRDPDDVEAIDWD